MHNYRQSKWREVVNRALYAPRAQLVSALVTEHNNIISVLIQRHNAVALLRTFTHTTPSGWNVAVPAIKFVNLNECDFVLLLTFICRNDNKNPGRKHRRKLGQPRFFSSARRRKFAIGTKKTTSKNRFRIKKIGAGFRPRASSALGLYVWPNCWSHLVKRLSLDVRTKRNRDKIIFYEKV